MSQGGSCRPASHEDRPSGQQNADDDADEAEDDMPPLEYIGSCPSLNVSLKEGSRVVLKGLSSEHLNGQQGTVMPMTRATNERLPIKLDTSANEVLIRPCNLEVAREVYQNSMPPANDAGRSASGSDDDMPPLDYVGAASGLDVASAYAANSSGLSELSIGCRVVLKGLSSTKLNGQRGTIVNSKGLPSDRVCVKLDQSHQRSFVKPCCIEMSEQRDGGDSESADSMPPLDYVACKPFSPGVCDNAGDASSDDDMPPLDYFVADRQEQEHAPHKAAQRGDDGMPPLEYVGTNSTLFSFKVGDKIVLRGLSKIDLNGRGGEIMPFDNAPKQRLPIRLLVSGQRLLVKPENLERVCAGAASDRVDDYKVLDDVDDDMPPLDYIGSGSALKQPRDISQDAESDSDMPPLQYVGQHSAMATHRNYGVSGGSANAAGPNPLQGSPPESRRQCAFGDIVTLKNMRSVDLNGQQAKIVKATFGTEQRVPVKLQGSGKHILVKWANFDFAEPDETAGTDDSLPPLEGIDEAVAPGLASESSQLAACGSFGRVQALLEKMRRASLQNATLADVCEAITHVEAEKGLDWGDQLKKKKTLLKKVRTKKQKLEEGVADPTPAGAMSTIAAAQRTGAVSTSDRTPTPVAILSQASAQIEKIRTSSQSERDWVVLGSSAAHGGSPSDIAGGVHSQALAGLTAVEASLGFTGLSSLVTWCQEHRLPLDLISRLQEEDVTDPEELVEIKDEELAHLTVGWKLGPKGRFMKAVQRMRAAARSEMGSAYCPSERC